MCIPVCPEQALTDSRLSKSAMADSLDTKIAIVEVPQPSRRDDPSLKASLKASAKTR